MLVGCVRRCGSSNRIISGWAGESWLHNMHQIWGGGVRVRGRDLTRVVVGLITSVAASGLPIRVSGSGPMRGRSSVPGLRLIVGDAGHSEWCGLGEAAISEKTIVLGIEAFTLGGSVHFFLVRSYNP